MPKFFLPKNTHIPGLIGVNNFENYLGELGNQKSIVKNDFFLKLPLQDLVFLNYNSATKAFAKMVGYSEARTMMKEFTQPVPFNNTDFSVLETFISNAKTLRDDFSKKTGKQYKLGFRLYLGHAKTVPTAGPFLSTVIVPVCFLEKSPGVVDFDSVLEDSVFAITGTPFFALLFSANPGDGKPFSSLTADKGKCTTLLEAKDDQPNPAEATKVIFHAYENDFESFLNGLERKPTTMEVYYGRYFSAPSDRSKLTLLVSFSDAEGPIKCNMGGPLVAGFFYDQGDLIPPNPNPDSSF